MWEKLIKDKVLNDVVKGVDELVEETKKHREYLMNCSPRTNQKEISTALITCAQVLKAYEYVYDVIETVRAEYSC